MGRDHDEDMTPMEFEAAFENGVPVQPTGHPVVVVEQVMPGATTGIVDLTWPIGEVGTLEFPSARGTELPPGSRMPDTNGTRGPVPVA